MEGKREASVFSMLRVKPFVLARERLLWEISGSRGGEDDDVLLGCDAV
jgi:hypothetical protein